MHQSVITFNYYLVLLLVGNAFIGKDCFNSVLKLEAYINPKCVTVVAGIEPRPAAPGANNATTRPCIPII